MCKIRQIFIAAVFVLTFISWSLTVAAGQELPNYLFLEVVDSDGNPVKNATVEPASSSQQNLKTDERGTARFDISWASRDFAYSLFKISLPGYFSYQDLGAPIVKYRTEVKIELLKMPQTKAERKALGNEQLKREFMWAVKIGDSKTVRKLLKSGISANITTNDLRGISEPKNIPAIIFAASSGDGETVKTLLKAKAKVRTKKEPIQSVLAYYLRANPFVRRESATETEKAKLLAEYEDGVKNLIKAGASLKDFDDYGTTSLMISAEQGYAGVVQILLAQGLAVNEKNDVGSTALMSAVSYSRKNPDFPAIKVVEILLKAGADTNIAVNPLEQYNCKSVLMEATWHADLEIMKLLIKNKADVNFACKNGATALKSAKQYTGGGQIYWQMINLLKAAGAKE